MKTFAFFISLVFLTDLQVAGQVGVMYQMQGKGNGMLGLSTQLQYASPFHLARKGWKPSWGLGWTIRTFLWKPISKTAKV